MSAIFEPYLLLVTGLILLPLPSLQHFIWPLSWCLLADICNHTWFPVCGEDLGALIESDRYKKFLDECDMFEYNCDRDVDYDVTYFDYCSAPRCVPVAKPCKHKHSKFNRPPPEHPLLLNPGRRLLPTTEMRIIRGHKRVRRRRKKNTFVWTTQQEAIETTQWTPPRTQPQPKPSRTTTQLQRRKIARRIQSSVSSTFTTTKRLRRRKTARQTQSSVSSTFTITRQTTTARQTQNTVNKHMTSIPPKTVILKQDIVIRNGMKYLRVVKGVPRVLVPIWKNGT